MSRRVRDAVLRALALCVLLCASPSGAADDAWSDSDVEAAERYRAEERERADRYRAQVEAARTEAPAPPRRADPSGRGSAEPRSGRAAEGLGQRLADALRAWLEEVFAELIEAITDALRGALSELLGGKREEPPRHDLAPRERGSLGAWLRREQARAEDWAEGAARSAPLDPESLREWQQREAERARELAKRAREEARERARRNARLEREARERADWDERWRDAEAWRREAAEWEAEERLRLERAD